jgi:3-oxoacyl-[acyl-carrier-protein] synthase-3
VLGEVPEPDGFTDFALGSDGTRADYVLIPAGGSRIPADTRTLRCGAHHIRMDGRAVSHFMDAIVPRIVADALDRNGLTLQDIACLASHQPNPAALRRLAERVGVPAERLVIVGDRVGNIGAASAPYALATAAARDQLHLGDRVLLTVFGAGMTWGTALLRWSGARAAGIDTARTPAGTDNGRLFTS